MGKKSRSGYPRAFQRNALERMRCANHIGALAKKLGVSRGTLYAWRRKAEGLPPSPKGRASQPEADDRGGPLEGAEAKVTLLERELGSHTLGNGLFKSVLPRIEELDRREEGQGGIPSMRKSAARRKRKGN